MKHLIFILACVLLLLNVAGCGQRDKSKNIEQYKYDENSNVLTVNIKKEFEPWVKEGAICYGIIMVCDIAGNPLRIKEVRVKVLEIKPGSIKMEALEDITINRTIECRKVSFKKGDSWNEEYGEIFKTREGAIKYIDDNYPGLRIK